LILGPSRLVRNAFLAPARGTWYYPVDNELLCLSEPISQRKRSVPPPTDSVPVRLPRAVRLCSYAVAVRVVRASLSPPSSMLPRPKRLTRVTFGSVVQGKRAVSAHFSVTAAKSEEGRAAAVISKKVARRAVDRHLLKRRMLAVAAPHVRAGRSFVIYARAGSLTLSYAALKRELETLLTTLPSV
jgi:ribonuclease P protein component